MYTKDEMKGILMCLGKPFTAIYGSEDKTIIRTQIIIRGRKEFLEALQETMKQYEIESNYQRTNSGSLITIAKRDSLYRILDLWDELPNIFPKGNEHHWRLLKDFLEEVKNDTHLNNDGVNELKWMIQNAKSS